MDDYHLGHIHHAIATMRLKFPKPQWQKINQWFVFSPGLCEVQVETTQMHFQTQEIETRRARNPKNQAAQFSRDVVAPVKCLKASSLTTNEQSVPSVRSPFSSKPQLLCDQITMNFISTFSKRVES